MKFSGVLILALALVPGAPAQTITTIAGTGEGGFGGDGGPAIRARFSDPRYLGVDAAGNVYIADTNNQRIRKVSPAGQIMTAAGNGDTSESVPGPAIKSGFIGIGGIAVAPDGAFYIASPSGLQKVDAAGTLSFVVTGQSVQGVALSASGAVYLSGVADVTLLGAKGSMKVVGGTDTGDAGDGGPASKARFYATQVTTDPAGNIYVVDSEAHRIRKFLPGGVITTFAGNGKAGFAGDRGQADRAQLDRPQGIAFDVAGNAYIADTGNFRIRRVGLDGTITTISGTGRNEKAGDGGPALQASFSEPSHIAVGCAGVFVTDAETVREIAVTTPLIAYNGISDGNGKASLAPGQAFSLDGCNLAGGTVSINGIPATISLTGPTQIKGVAPARIVPGMASVIVAVSGKNSNTLFVSVKSQTK
jgi:NHL repeat